MLVDFFLLKQKTAYEMRISDWSSDVCSSDLARRIVITATDSVAQRFDTVFPEYFIRALTDGASDIDKNGRVSVWEAFSAASLAVRRHYTQRGQLATERDRKSVV